MINLPDPPQGKMPPRELTGPAERVLHFYLCSKDNGQPSQVRALKEWGSDGYGQVKITDPAVFTLGLAAAKAMRPSVIFIQAQNPKFDIAYLRELRKVADNPKLVIVNWSGDVAWANAPTRNALYWAIDMAAPGGVDLLLWSSFNHVDILRAAGATAGFLQIGYDEEFFFEPKDDVQPLYDVTFLYHEHHHRIRRSLAEYDDCDSRTAAGKALLRNFERAIVGSRVPIPSEAGDVYRKTKLAVSISASNSMLRYTSDRLFRAMACTATMVKRFPGWQTLGLRDGENCITFDSTEELIRLAKDWSADCMQKHLLAVRKAGAQLVREHHTWGVRVQELRPFIRAVREQRT